MKSLLIFCVGVILSFDGASSFIVIPDEIPTLLSVIYSNIPIIKKGTDSRLGWGFRLGERADFQVMVELGPQKNTQPLANQGDSNTNKRDTVNNMANTLWAQMQEARREKQRVKEQTEKKQEKDAWLQNWKNQMTEENFQAPIGTGLINEDEIKPGLGIGEIDAKSVIPEDDNSDSVAAVPLRILYNKVEEKPELIKEKPEEKEITNDIPKN